jgi:sporulation protein YlmC with PRC-barrel domain
VAGEDRLRELEEKYEGYKVYDNNGESIGKVDDLFVDEGDREEYIGVKMGLFGLSGTTLIPMEIARVNDRDRVIEVAESKSRVKDAPHYDDDDEIDRSFEERIRSHFGLAGVSASTVSYDQPTDDTGAEGSGAGDNTMGGDRAGTSDGGSGERMGREEYRNRDDYVSDSAMVSAAGGATTSGGVSDFETGDREGSNYRESGQEYGEGERQGGATSAGNEGSGDADYREAYMEGYRQAIRDSAGQGGTEPSGSTAFGEGQSGGSGESDGVQDYGTASTGSGSGGGRDDDQQGEGKTRVFRLRRD